MKPILSLLLSVFLAGVVHAADYGGVGGRPALPDETEIALDRDPADPRAKSWFLYTLNPGESRQDVLVVQNSSDQPVKLMLYPADSTPSTDGGFALEQQVESRDFVGKWVTLSASEVELAPREIRQVPFTIQVPDDSTLDVGEHTGGILMQKISSDTDEGAGLRLFTRVGVRIYVTIPGEITKGLEVEDFKVLYDPDRRMYVAQTIVKNTGNVSQNITVKTDVSSLSSELAASVAKLDEMAVQNSRDLQVLRGDRLISSVEFPKPIFGKLKVQTWVSYENGKKTLQADPIVVKVPMERSIVLLLLLVAAFTAAVFALFTLQRYSHQKTRRENKRL